ncbi:MAG TPA: YibE/F family protein [Actinomycetota bacterium]|nr:YibE/F family protein [Actinomycetota bacterium]
MGEDSHGHSRPSLQAEPRVQRLLLLTIVPIAVVAVVAAILLWPSAEPKGVVAPASSELQQLEASVIGIEQETCDPNLFPQGGDCSTIAVRLEAGPDEGNTIHLPSAGPSISERFAPGDKIFVNYSPEGPVETRYSFADFRRGVPLLILGALFAVVVVALSRWKGLAALVGLAISLLILSRFVLPAILEGSNPVVVVITGGALIMFVTLYLAHGFNALTSTALLGTLVSLVLTGFLAFLFVEIGNFTGLASEEALFLQFSADQVNLKGLLLGGIIIGALGVLDDVTVTQASAVWELNSANPRMGFAELYKSALRIGRDHISSTVNTLVLAYAGSSLPLLVLFAVSNQSLGRTLNGEVIAEEVVRTGVGSIGLVASVPITTALAAAVLTGHFPQRIGRRKDVEDSAGPRKEKDFRVPRAEREWRDKTDS